jgi:paraquat-inducible protein A
MPIPAATHPYRGVAVNLLLLVALLLLALGVTLPLLTVERFYVFTNTVSLLSALGRLGERGHWGLALLIGSFSLAFPTLKLLLLAAIWNLEGANSPRQRRHLRWLARFGRWSMLDVFVVALLVVSVKLGALAQARVEIGIYAFAASVILTMLLSSWIGRVSGQG